MKSEKKNALKNNKAPCEDGLAAEFIKDSGEELINKIEKLIREV